MTEHQKIAINWETEEDDLKAELSQEDTEFANLLSDETLGKSSPNPHPTSRPRIGDRITARISYISSKTGDVLLDLGGKLSAVMTKQDLLDAEGNFTKAVGDEVAAYVISQKNGELFLGSSLAQGMRDENALETAFENHLPVKGKITASQKGGFTVMIYGRKAFCPVSHVSNRFIADTESYVGKEFDFLIKNFSSHNLVVSRAELLHQQAEAALADLKEKMAADIPVKATVEEIKDFGLVVDLGGIGGLVHVSELGYGYSERPGDHYKIGDQLTVKVLKIEPMPGRVMARISLSRKALENDPWDTVAATFHQGESYRGRVSRLADFGAFIELAPGIDGLIHLSEMSWEKRVHHPRDILKVGDLVSVRILDIDTHRKRISLSIKAIEDDPWFEIEKKFTVGQSYPATIISLRSFGAIAELAPGITGLLPISTLKQVFGENYRKKASPPQQLTLVVGSIALHEHKILLTLPHVDAHAEEQGYFAEYLNEKSQQAEGQTAALAESTSGSFGDLLQQSMKSKPGK